MKWLDLIGWAGSGLLVWSLLQSRILRLRVLNFIGCLVLIGYNGALRVWPMVGLNIVLAVINAVYLRKLFASRHDERVYTVVEVRPDDAFLAHTLQAHESDIRQFNPGFVLYADAANRLSFLVAQGDQIVGIVLVRPVDPDVAQVELDYVTPPFRDFTPGEFVYRRSHLFADHGFRKIVTPAGMVGAYYDRIGFQRRGDVYVLDIPSA